MQGGERAAIPADQDESIAELQLDSLEEYQSAMDGWIKPVDLHGLRVTVDVNEGGPLRNLPVNPRATFLWWYFVTEARQKAMLVGPALVVGLSDRQGDSTDIPSEVAERLLRAGVWRIEVKVPNESDWVRVPATHRDYFQALVQAMVALERWAEAEDVRVVPVQSDEVASEASSPPTAA